MYRHLEKNHLMPVEQKGCRKGSYGCKEILLLNKVILNDVKKRKRNVSMAWIDYQKAFHSVPHDWILKTLEIYRFHPRLIEFGKASMKSWSTRLLIQSRKEAVETRSIQFNRGIFQ